MLRTHEPLPRFERTRQRKRRRTREPISRLLRTISQHSSATRTRSPRVLARPAERSLACREPLEKNSVIHKRRYSIIIKAGATRQRYSQMEPRFSTTGLHYRPRPQAPIIDLDDRPPLQASTTALRSCSRSGRTPARPRKRRCRPTCPPTSRARATGCSRGSRRHPCLF